MRCILFSNVFVGSFFSKNDRRINKNHKGIKNLNEKYAKPEHSVPFKVIKENIGLFCLECLTFILIKNHFQKAYVNELNDTIVKSNYRPVGILPFVSKAFKKCLYDQFYAYTDSIVSEDQLSFRKGYSTQ